MGCGAPVCGGGGRFEDKVSLLLASGGLTCCFVTGKIVEVVSSSPSTVRNDRKLRV